MRYRFAGDRQMPTSITSITLLASLVLIVVALFGGGIEVKEVKIPPLPIVPRAASFLVGCILLGLVLFDRPLLEPQPKPGDTTTPEKKRDLGTAITNHMIEVREVKRILQQLGFYVGAITNEPDDAYFQAVANFQNAQHIDQDGLVGAQTYGKLREAWPEYFGQKQNQ
jgi:Putative peptidoglycan binding domain